MTKYRALVYADGSCTLLEKKRWIWREVTTMVGGPHDSQCVARRWSSLDAAKAQIAEWHKDDAELALRNQYVKTVELGEFKP